MLAQNAVPRSALRSATLAGCIAGLAPDLDFFIQSPDDPLLQLDYHRHFTHSLIVAPLAGLLIATLLWLWPALRRQLKFWQLLLVTTLGVLGSGLLDACTSYGTHLLWPFSDKSIAWNIIAIVDPVFTLLLAVGSWLAWRRRRVVAARLALLLALAYLALAAYQHQRAEAVMKTLAKSRGHVIKASVVKPTLGNIILWRSVYRAGNDYYVDAVRVGLESRIIAGAAIPVLRLEDDFPALAQQPTSRLYYDVQRFARFSDGFLVRHPVYPEVIGDIRYALLPDSVEPLWGIVIDPRRFDEHAPFRHYRALDKSSRQRFLTMLLQGK